MGRNLLCCQPREMSRWGGRFGADRGLDFLGPWGRSRQEEAPGALPLGAHSLRKENVGLETLQGAPSLEAVAPPLNTHTRSLLTACFSVWSRGHLVWGLALPAPSGPVWAQLSSVLDLRDTALPPLSPGKDSFPDPFPGLSGRAPPRRACLMLQPQGCAPPRLPRESRGPSLERGPEGPGLPKEHEPPSWSPRGGCRRVARPHQGRPCRPDLEAGCGWAVGGGRRAVGSQASVQPRTWFIVVPG